MKQLKHNKYKAEYIIWLDHYVKHNGNWFNLEEELKADDKPMKMHIIGYVIKETKDIVMLANCIQDDLTNIGQPNIILKSCIVKRVPIYAK